MTQARDAFNAAAQVGLSSFDKRTLDTVILGIKETTDATLSAAGTNTQVQYNNNGDFGASANFTWTSVDDLLTVGGNLKFSATGSAATTDTGIYSPGADQLAISTGGTGRLFVDANGNVTVDSIASAIGFFNARKGGAADQVFHIENRTTATGVDYNVAKTLKVNLVHGGKNAGFDAGWQFNSGCGSGQVSNNGYFAISKLTAQDGSSSSEVFRITSDGKLGVGTSSPPSLLSLSASNATPPGINIQNTTSSAGATASIAFSMSAVAGATGALIRAERLGGSAQSELSFWTGSAGGTNVRALTIDQSQRVGIGTATPGSALEINAAASTSPFIAKINTSEVARIDSSGRLLVGTSTSTGVATSGEAKLQIATVGDIPASFYSTADAIGPGGVIALGHARGSVTGLVLNNDVLGQIRFAGGDNTDLQTIGGQITCEVDGTPGANTMPGRLIFSTTSTTPGASPTERMRITSDGYARLSANSGGIQFNGDTAAANALDDYEEGTFTVTLLVDGTTGSASAGPTITTGSYTKVGDIVTISVTLRQQPTTTTGAVTLSGTLPFTPVRRTEFVIGSSRALDITNGSVVVGSINNSAGLFIYTLNDDIDYLANGGTLTTADARTIKTLSFSGSYVAV